MAKEKILFKAKYFKADGTPDRRRAIWKTHTPDDLYIPKDAKYYKKDGTPDKRFASFKGINFTKDGTPDRRQAISRAIEDVYKYTPLAEPPRDYFTEGEETDGEEGESVGVDEIGGQSWIIKNTIEDLMRNGNLQTVSINGKNFSLTGDDDEVNLVLAKFEIDRVIERMIKEYRKEKPDSKESDKEIEYKIVLTLVYDTQNGSAEMR